MLLGFVILLGIVLYLIHMATQLTVETYRREWTPPEELSAWPGEAVCLASGDGARICGDFYEASPRRDLAVVIAHGRGGNRHLSCHWALVFLRTGVSAMTFDFRGYGESDGRISTVAWREQDDMLAAVRWLKHEKGFARVVVLGCSMGGAAAILAAARAPEAIDGVIADSAFARMDEAMAHTARLAGLPPLLARLAKVGVRWRYGLRAERLAPENSVHRIAPRPLLLIHGEADLLIPCADAQRLYDRAGAPKSLWVLPGIAHGHALWDAPDEYARRVQDFIAPLREAAQSAMT